MATYLITHEVDAYKEFMQSEVAADAIRHDGVRIETLVVLADG